MAKKLNNKEIMAKMSELEGNLMDYIPENEEGTDRVKLLDRIISINSGEEKLNDDELMAVLNEGQSLLKVETEVKKQKKVSKKKAEEPEEKKKPKKKLKNPLRKHLNLR